MPEPTKKKRKHMEGADKKKETWKSDSHDGALLFLLLHKQIAGHPDDFSPSELQDQPFGFDKCSSQTLKRNSQTIANRVKKFEENGTGLTKDFKALIKQILEEKPELFPCTEEKDEDFKPGEVEEDDISHISQAEDEQSLSDPLQDKRFDTGTPEQPPIDKENIVDGSRKKQISAKSTKMTKTTVQTSTMQQSELGKFAKLSLPNGLVFCDGLGGHQAQPRHS